MIRDTHSMANALTSTGFHPETAFLTQQKHKFNTSKQDDRTTLWVEELNALGERSNEWPDRGITPNEHLVCAQRHRWALVHLEEFESAESAERTMSGGHDENVEALSYRSGRDRLYLILWRGDAPKCTWTDLAIPPLAGVNCATNTGRNLSNTNYRGLDEED